MIMRISEGYEVLGWNAVTVNLRECDMPSTHIYFVPQVQQRTIFTTPTLEKTSTKEMRYWGNHWTIRETVTSPGPRPAKMRNTPRAPADEDFRSIGAGSVGTIFNCGNTAVAGLFFWYKYSMQKITIQCRISGWRRSRSRSVLHADPELFLPRVRASCVLRHISPEYTVYGYDSGCSWECEKRRWRMTGASGSCFVSREAPVQALGARVLWIRRCREDVRRKGWLDAGICE